MVTDIILAIIAVILALSMAQREVIARRQAETLKSNTDTMEDLRQTLNTFMEMVHNVQTYGLRLQK